MSSAIQKSLSRRKNRGGMLDALLFAFPLKLSSGSEQKDKRCPVNCPTCLKCTTPELPPEVMDWACFTDIINRMGPYISRVKLQGISTALHFPRILEMIRFARKQDVYTNYFTDGKEMKSWLAQGLIEAGLDEITFVFDSTGNHALTQQRRGRPYEQEKKALTSFCKVKQISKAAYPLVSLQWRKLPHNEHEIPSLEKFAKEITNEEVRFRINTGSCSSSEKEKNLEVVVSEEGVRLQTLE